MDLARDAENQLILAFQHGDASAFESLYGRHHRPVLNVACRLLGDRDTAEDIAQEVFLKLYTSPKSYKPTARLSTWLYRVTYNACIDEMRRRQTAPTELAQDDNLQSLDRAASPESAAESNELARAVQSVIMSLPEKQRIAVILQRYEGLSYQEIADVLKTSLAAVESLLFRAKETLKAALAPYVEDPNESTGVQSPQLFINPTASISQSHTFHE